VSGKMNAPGGEHTGAGDGREEHRPPLVVRLRQYLGLIRIMPIETSLIGRCYDELSRLRGEVESLSHRLATVDRPRALIDPADQAEGGAAPEWEFLSEGWNDADDPAEAGRGWMAKEVADSYREKWPRFLAAVEGPGPLGVNHEVLSGAPIGREDPLAQNTVLAFAYAFARASRDSSKISVLDWGGALGHYYVLARRLFSDVELDYHCREAPAVCAEGRRVLPEATFHESDACLDRTYDLVLSSGSLQYAEEWQDFVGKLATAARDWVYITRIPMARLHPSFVVLQRAYAYGYATEYRGWVFNHDEFVGAAERAGLRLEREFVLGASMPIEGAPDTAQSGGFLFRSRRATETTRSGRGG
jgi:putative methyltransferase (TIGR04325 family)